MGRAQATAGVPPPAVPPQWSPQWALRRWLRRLPQPLQLDLAPPCPGRPHRWCPRPLPPPPLLPLPPLPLPRDRHRSSRMRTGSSGRRSPRPNTEMWRWPGGTRLPRHASACLRRRTTGTTRRCLSTSQTSGARSRQLPGTTPLPSAPSPVSPPLLRSAGRPHDLPQSHRLAATPRPTLPRGLSSPRWQPCHSQRPTRRPRRSSICLPKPSR
mmetsp:Transcript_137110/g.356232  ORF Transcript_137110/g.356232 Transcript_137110/m.356232 type:complete len:212 (+) Transcript_137110:231-866(+)